MLRGRSSLYNYAALPTQNEAPNNVMLGERNSLHNYFRGNDRRDSSKEVGRVHGSFCRPAAVSRYPGAVVAGSARTRSTRTENVSHVWYWSGRITGLAPATRIRTSGSY